MLEQCAVSTDRKKKRAYLRHMQNWLVYRSLLTFAFCCRIEMGIKVERGTKYCPLSSLEVNVGWFVGREMCSVAYRDTF